MPMAVGAPSFVAARTTGWNSFHCLVKPLLGASNFTLVRGAEVVRLTWSGSEGRVTEVEYADRNESGALKRVSCRAVVLAAGTLDSTRILLQSRSSDFPNGLGNTEGLLGRFLHDHPRQWWPVKLARPLSILAHPMYIAREPHGTGSPLLATSLTIGAARGPSRVRSWYGGSTRSFGVQVFGTMVPQEDHTISLPEHTTDAERLNAPLRINIQYDTPTLDNVAHARRRFTELFGVAGIRAEPIGPFHDLVPGSSVHYAGTVRMHADRKFGVLDGYNRVHDATNVFVTDMSCFTTNPEKNPTLTAMALSCRAAVKLAETLR
jgi:choline dehydrogenase-like flavoprotein